MQSKNAKILASLRRFSLFESMSDEQLLDILPQLSPRETKHLSGETIVRANTPAESILIVLEGTATAYRTTAGGSYFIAEVYPTGWLFGGCRAIPGKKFIICSKNSPGIFTDLC